MRDRLADGLVEIALGVGFVLTGRVFVTFGETLAPETLFSDVFGLVLRLSVISLLLPAIVLLIQLVLDLRGPRVVERPVQPHSGDSWHVLMPRRWPRRRTPFRRFSA